ncbi:hypothetical protein F4859DRAFT_80379 [Xylaria cf. heliscus]|nr:hypothetical protein F4859DRAFT_80379 [Xylaria cf. heliscus]
MKPPAASKSEHSVPPNQSGIHSPDHLSSDVEGSTAGIDRKAKKRIQNRVAQRTYRTRIKQRLQDLQQQVQTLQQKEEEQQRDAQREAKADDSGNEETTFYTSISGSHSPTFINGHGEEQQSPEITCQDFHGIHATNSGPWTGIPSHPNMWSPPPERTRFAYNNFDNMPGRPPLATMPAVAPTTLPLDTSGSVLCSHTCQGEHLQNTLAFSHRAEDNLQHRIVNPASNVFETNQDERIGQFQGFNSSHLSPWLHKLELRPPAHDPTPAAAAKQTSMHQPFYQDGTMSTPMATNPTQWQENMLPNTQTTVEEQFEYVLSCAQRVGFDSFDTMALHYYTRNFNPTSTIALEQHLSRNRRLPELLAELRKQSTNWNEWQRRGYQGETLKAAEEICSVEYGDFRRFEGSGGGEGEFLNEAALGDMLPNLWALLTGLVSRNQQLSQRQISEVVFTCMRLLCGLEGSQNQAATSSRPSPR